MTTSTTATFDPTADEIITVALQELQVLNAEHEPEAAHLTMGRRFLNLIMKSMANEGVSLRAIERVTFTVTAGVATITPDTDTEDVTAMFWRGTDGIDHPMDKRPRDEYDTIGDKAISAPPSQFFFERPNGNARIYLWPVPDAQVVSVTYARRRRYRDTDSGAVTLDVPQTWHLAVSYKLAAMLAPHFGMSDKRAAFLEDYDREKYLANLADCETGSIRFVVGEGCTRD